MNLPYFIARRITNNASGSFSTVINKIAVISISVALAALITSFMILKGFEETIKEKIYSFSGHLTVSKYTLSTSFEQSSIVVEDSLLTRLGELPGVDYLQTYAFKAGLLKTEEEVQGVILKGLDQYFDTTMFSRHMIAGHFPRFPETGYGTEVALSYKIANYLRLSIGDEVLVFFIQDPPRYRNLKITGIYETGLEDFDEKVILGDINLVRRLNGWGEHTVGGIEIYLDDPKTMDVAESMVFENTSSDLYVDKVSDKYIQIFDWLGMLDRNVVIFFTLMVCVASFNMISIILILIMERTHMIGTLKALGSGNGLLRRIFFVNGVNLILKGIFWGNVFGLGCCYLQDRFKLIPLDPTNYYMNHVPISFDYMAVLLLNLLVVTITGFTLFIPLTVISRIRPIKAIRFD